jgi:FMN phosphatase YigB (HAD superfamily)
MLDLDGTLLQISQKEFIDAYFAKLMKVFLRLGMDAEMSVKAVWAGTKAMMLNDGSKLNTHRFWETFAQTLQLTEEQLRKVELACDNFYINEFDEVKAVIKPNDISKRLVKAMAKKGYTLVLATNPLFPACAVETRLGWIGLEPDDFEYITHYANSTYCKLNPGYYNEIFDKINRLPGQCFMAGNNPAEDMCAGLLGAEIFLVTDYLENESGMDITPFRSGTLAELDEYLTALPDVL